jgi:hypothetical protein
LVVAFLAIIIVVIAYLQQPGFWKSLLLNLSTEFLGVVFVFLLVNLIFVVDDWNLSEKVTKLITKLEHPSAKDFFVKSPSHHDLQENIQSSKEIILSGVTLTGTINRNFSSLREKLFEGTDIRILIIGQLSEVLATTANRSESGSVDYYQKRLDSTLKELEYLHENWFDKKKDEKVIGNFSLKFLPYPPCFGILGFNPGRNDSVLFIEIYPHHSGYEAPPNFFLTKEKDGVWYDYFINQFEEMWNRGIEWKPQSKLTDDD